jgi:hypothetical protein
MATLHIVIADPIGDKKALNEALSGVELSLVEADGTFTIDRELDPEEASCLSEAKGCSGIWNSSRELIGVLNGLMLSFDAGWPRLVFQTMKWTGDDGNTQWVPISGSGALVISGAMISGRGTTQEGSEQPPKSEAPIPRSARVLMRAGLDPKVSAALRLRDSGWSWADMYKVFEIIQMDIGNNHGLVAKEWTTKTALDAFTASANRPDVSGDSARHAVAKGAQPSRTMTLADARRFINGLLRKWLDFKISSTGTT